MLNRLCWRSLPAATPSLTWSRIKTASKKTTLKALVRRVAYVAGVEAGSATEDIKHSVEVVVLPMTAVKTPMLRDEGFGLQMQQVQRPRPSSTRRVISAWGRLTTMAWHVGHWMSRVQVCAAAGPSSSRAWRLVFGPTMVPCYDAMPEASQALSVFSPALAAVPSIFSSATLRHVLKFALTAGGGGLSRKDQVSLACMLRKVDVTAGGEGEAEFSSPFPSNPSFATGIRREQNRVLSKLKWLEVPIEVNGKIYQFFHRDLLDVAVEALKGAATLDLEVGSLPKTVYGWTRRSGTLSADQCLKEAETFKSLHGPSTRILSTSIHADEALVSWSRAHYIFSVRAHFPSAVGSGRVTVGYIPHIGKPMRHSPAARLAVSDARNDLLQQCLAAVMRRFLRASEV